MLVSGRVVLRWGRRFRSKLGSHVVGFHPSFGRRYGDSGPFVCLGEGVTVTYHMYRYIQTWNPNKQPVLNGWKW